MLVSLVVRVETKKVDSLIEHLEKECGPVRSYCLLGDEIVSIHIKEKLGKTARVAADEFGIEVRNWWPL